MAVTAILFIRIMFAVVLLPAAVVLCHFPSTLTLERAIPPSHELELSQLVARDRIRHGRLLQSANGIVDLAVEGTFDPFVVGLYYTKVQLGSPPREFNVQIDTGSDVLWVSCSSCNGCPVSSGLQQVQLNFFDPGSSSTASLISCSDQRCSLGLESADSGCAAQNNQCSYTFQYGDGSGTSGYYVADLMHLDTILEGSLTSNSSAQIFFGCSTLQTGDLTKPDRAVDGIFGFGQQSMSVISQLSSQGITPRVFSHCLKGNGGSGGILVLGEVVEPNIVYSPLVPSQPHYNLNLQSISVNGQTLPIDSSVFATSSNRGTIVDSGTTLAYLAEGAYDPLMNAILGSVSQSVHPIVNKGNQCYIVTSSVADLFPQVSFNFAGGASLILNPQDYLIQQNSIPHIFAKLKAYKSWIPRIPDQYVVIFLTGWCCSVVHWLSEDSGSNNFRRDQLMSISVFADLVLKDKIFVYDLEGQRIGWTDYDCSMSVNVSTTSRTGRSEFVNAGQLSDNSSPRYVPHKLILKSLIAFLFNIFMFGSFVVL
ncbi:hypothetical protein EZV62_002308 [Acer yangbiense]|uniref:Peptidase A1 domain-containing protein n=1 Tax=Acer yangbiense TaxID=1000413 RepID=A0A5C7IXA8_9ROSI|nr:hypothetical protein EZV62_002308 [Acer yangbiense]